MPAEAGQSGQQASVVVMTPVSAGGYGYTLESSLPFSAPMGRAQCSEPRKDGSEYQAIRLIALPSTCEPLRLRVS